MAEPSQDWKTALKEKLISMFGEEAETLTRILWYLDEEDKMHACEKDSSFIPPVWRSLQLTLYQDKAFRAYAERLAQDTKRAEKDATYRTTMNLFYSQIMDPSDEAVPEELGQDFDKLRLVDPKVIDRSAFVGLARAWPKIPSPTQNVIMKALPKIINNKQLVSCVDEAVGMVNEVGGSIVMVGLAALHLGYDVIVNLRRWWNDEITGVRCAKNVLDSFLTITAGVAGGAGGAAIGALAGPIGMLIGGVIGGIVSSAGMNMLSDRLTQWLFGIPKDEALENAYRYFGVDKNASNNAINTAFHRLCLKHHPDKGGSSEEFLFLQLNMGTIKAARGQL